MARILTEHIEPKDSSDSKLQIESISSIRILSILEVQVQITLNREQHFTPWSKSGNTELLQVAISKGEERLQVNLKRFWWFCGLRVERSLPVYARPDRDYEQSRRSDLVDYASLGSLVQPSST